MNCAKSIGGFFCCLFFSLQSYCQVLNCPANIDFKEGNFSNWNCRVGNVSSIGGINTLTWLQNGPNPNNHQLIPPTNTEVDEFGGFPKHCPNSTSYSVKLGNPVGGHEAEGLFYTFTIPATATKFSLLYNYAIVLQNPGHLAHEQPRFRARIVDIESGEEVNCVSFDFTASGVLPGFKPTASGNGVYKDWTPISVDLSNYAGKTIRLEFITSDCVYLEHFGYAYINVSSFCNGGVEGSSYCQGDSTTTLTAPHGYQSYQWFSDNSFSQALSNTQTLTLNINTTPPGSLMPVIVSPFPGYGCVDTLYTQIAQAQKPAAFAGLDQTVCSKLPVRIGAPNNDSYSYQWTPANLVSNPVISDPLTAYGLTSATQLVVKTTDLSTGCVANDTVLITPLVTDTASQITGKLIYCPDEGLNTSLSIVNPPNSIQWFQGNSPIPGATNTTYQPATTGSFWAELREGGCIDSTRLFIIKEAPLPKPAFIMSKDIQCANEPVLFTNRTPASPTDNFQYLWRFSDGSSVTVENAEKAFSVSGIYTATLVATSGINCTDSTAKTLMIVDECNPLLPTAFTPNNDGKNDELKPFLPGAKAFKRFSIYNRWGNVVFTTTREGQGWNGTYKGKALATDVFVWTIEYIGTDNKPQLKKGTVTLIK